MGGVSGGAARREAVLGAASALSGLRDDLPALASDELGPFLADLDALARSVDAARLAVVGEAVERGETGTGPHGTAPAAVRAYVEQWAPSQRHGGGASLLARTVLALRNPANAQVAEALMAPVDSGAEGLPLRTASVVLSEFDRLRDRIRPDAEPTVLAGLIAMGAGHGPDGVRAVRPRLLADFGRPGELQELQDRAKRFIALSHPSPDDRAHPDVYDYRLRLDPESMVVLEAALDGLAVPRPTLDSQGRAVPDPRPSDRRRGEALIDLVRRAVAVRGEAGSTPRGQLIVTMDLHDLTNRVRAGAAAATLADGTLLGPDTVRRLACDAEVIPAVLGGRGEVLDLGRAQRFFTQGQVRALRLRDRRCTYPGCSAPAAWGDAHHLWHWADGGPTDLSNAAVLCGRHHTVVHSQQLHGQVVGGRVEWDLTPGSYREFLRQRGLPPPMPGAPTSRTG